MGQPTREEQAELAWRAFQYISGELPAAESDQFEAQLGVDQPARETVAQVVELSQAIAESGQVAPVSAATPARSHWLRPVAWMSIGAALSLCAIFLVQSSGDREPSTSSVPPTATEALPSPDLALSALASELSVPAAEEEMDMAEAAQSEEVAVPNWLLTAVLRDQEMDMLQSEPREN